MLTKWTWDTIVFDDYDTGYKERISIEKIFFAVFLTILTIPLDILSSPLEIISFIIWKIIEKVEE